jgi:uncharacterized protein (DUF488 family)
VTVPSRLFTIGHSAHSADHFVDLLKMNGVSAVADVRSRPYSRFNPQFNRETLQPTLQAAGIAYRFLGRELGARSEDRSCYIDGKVQYDLLAQTPLFRRGLTRVINGVREHHVALMCAEKDPITCHRMVLVCHALRPEKLEIVHVCADGSLEPHVNAERRMMAAVGLQVSDLFTSGEEVVEEAYRVQGQRIAWVEPSGGPPGATIRLADTEALP